MSTTTDQDRRIAEHTTELGATTATVTPTPRPVRPCWNCGGSGAGCCEYAADPDSTSRVITVEYFGPDGDRLDRELVYGDGIPREVDEDLEEVPA